jgi:hypothetical protein
MRAVAALPLLGLYLVEEALKFKSSPGDEASFLAYAHNIVNGHYADTTSPLASHYLWHGPGLPLVMAPLVAAHVPVAAIRLLGPLFLYVAVLVLIRAGDLVAPRYGALGLGYALGLYWPAWFTLGHIYVEPLAILLMVTVLYHLVRTLRFGSGRSAVWAGIAGGLLALCRVEFGWVAVAAAVISGLWWLRRRNHSVPRRVFFVSVIALVVCLPWLGYTYSLTGRYFYWGNSGGLSLYWMSSSQHGDLGDWHDYPDVFRDPNLARHRAFFSQLERTPPLDQDAALESAALRQIEDHPLGYLRNLAFNTARLFVGTPDSFNEFRPDRSSLLANVPLLVSTLVAVAILRLRRRSVTPEVWPVATLTALVVAIHVPVAAFTRFLLPAVPLALWLCAAAMMQMHKSRREECGVSASGPEAPERPRLQCASQARKIATPAQQVDR